ncbi:response regulator [Halobaculum sp. WSA2]|uniref:Response regulator n=1 Tax=Halobaculum saliterrae TaxID=2073113 RepID=A0A6B0ST37_9EURY|nr:response regulator [Halobaculum saliterrae]MXR39843.1 response regulator [Halobaculum saliterrae]
MINILLAEDDSVHRSLIQRLLNDSRISVRCAKDGDEAVWFASVYNPDIVIMDLNMPVKDGLQATKQIKSIDPSIKVIISTARRSEQSIERAIEAGADEYLIKPYSKEEVLELIDSLSE